MFIEACSIISTMRICCTLIVFLLVANVPTARSQDFTGNCDNGTATEWLNISNFHFPIRNVGTIVGYDNNALPEVPAGSGNRPVEGLSFHLAGKVDEEVRAITTNWTYELWPGPARAISDSASTCLEYDQLWGLSIDDITIDHRPHTALHPVTEWPVEWGAPFYNNDGNPGFQIDGGDEPLMYGDQMYWSILNDRGDRHASTKSAPLGIEMEYFAYAFNSPGTLGNTVFFRFEISNRNSDKIEDFFFGLQLDQRRAMGTDWYHGTDSTTGTIYSYFSPEVDAAFEGISQSVGLTLVDASKRPKSDYQRFSTLPNQGFSHTMINWLFIQEQYDNAADVYDWIQAKWPELVIRRYGLKTKKLLSSMLGGMEEASSGPWTVVQPGDSTDYFFPGDPTLDEHWSMLNLDGKGNEMFAQTNYVYGGYGPVDLEPEDTFVVTAAMIWADGQDGFEAATKIRNDARFIQSIADIVASPRNTQQVPPISSTGLRVESYPNPTAQDITIRVHDPEMSRLEIDVFDSIGRIMWSHSASSSHPSPTTLQIPSGPWTAGVYFVRYRIGGRFYFGSFLRQ